MGGPEMAPQTPQRSSRPGGAVTLVCIASAARRSVALYTADAYALDSLRTGGADLRR